MSMNDWYGGESRNRVHNEFRMLPNVQTLTGNKTLAKDSPMLQYLDPGGAGRDVTLPAEADSKGLMFTIVNTADASEDLTVKDDGGATIGVVGQNECGLAVCNGVTWKLMVAGPDGNLAGQNVGNVADANTEGGIPVVHRIDQAAGDNGDTDVVLDHKTRVIDAWVVLTGAGVASSVCTVKNGANAITDGMDTSGSDKAIVRAATIDDANHEIAAGGTLRITGSGGASQPALTAYVLGLRVA